MNIHPLSDDHGTMHIWDVWVRSDYEVYRRYVPRFSSEFGFQGPPTWSTLLDAIPEGQLEPMSDAVLHHQKAKGGQEKVQRWLETHFHLPDPSDFGRVALRRATQPSPRGTTRRRMVALARAALHGGALLATQRLLAGHELGSGGRLRAQKTPLVRDAQVLRGQASHLSTWRGRPLSLFAQ